MTPEGNSGGEPPVRILSRAPVRINDIGGWTDTWFAGHGRVLNLAAGPGVETLIRVSPNPQREKRRVRVVARDFGETFLVEPEAPDLAHHPLLQAAIASFPVPEHLRLEIDLGSSVPAGISVGTSAAVCVSLLGGLCRLVGTDAAPEDISRMAHRVETERLGWQSGIQDQICAALGGICYIEMPEYPRAHVERLSIPERFYAELDSRLDVVYLGSSHNSSALHERVIETLEDEGPGFGELGRLRELAAEARSCLLAEDLAGYGEAMRSNTACQRALHADLVSPEAEAVISLAEAHGALGWKVNGAGGRGGSLTLLGSRDPEARKSMQGAIAGMGGGIRILPLRLTDAGLTVRSR
jgi:D-glycero-alpha-D-manno-heptose-7-phosphate kinase